LYPVMPTSAREIHSQLGLSSDVSKIKAADLRWGELREGTEIGEVKPLFPRIDKAKTMEEISGQRPEAREQKSEVRDQKSETEPQPSGRVQGSGQYATEAEAIPGISYI